MAETVERHLSAEDLASIATGQAPGATVATHLRHCADCSQDLARTERVVSALAEPVTLHEPPAGIWNGIERELGIAADPDAVLGDNGTVTFLPRARRRWPVITAAAAAGLVVGAAGAVVVAGLLSPRDGGDGSPTEPVAVGEAILAPVTDRQVEGRAEMVSEPDGVLRLTVDVSELPSQGYYEVWLRDERASRLISLGTVSGQSTTLPVPSGVDLDRFPVVDVSHEDFDGDPSHSGVTLAAGAMTRFGDSTTR